MVFECHAAMSCSKLILFLKQAKLDLPLPPPKGDSAHIPLWRGQGEVEYANFRT
jgi:hypothetical protein